MKKTIKGATAFALAIMLIGTTSVTVFAATAQDMMNKNIASYTAGTQSLYGPKLTQDQLNAVADVAADFKTNHANDSMTNDQKIRAGYDYIKNRVSYIDWDKGVGANTAYALVTGQGACSGMTRGFIALMDAVDVKSHLIHSDTNDHQWILTEFDDGFAFIDIDANVSSGFEAIYHANTHPYTYDTNGLPAVGSHSDEYGTKTAITEGWRQDANGWRYQNTDGSYPLNTWQVVNDKWYYFETSGYMAVNKWMGGTYYVGADGVMLTNTTTPDGYQVDGSGKWAQEQQSAAQVNGIRSWNENADLILGIHEEGRPLYYKENNNYVIDKSVNSFLFPGNVANVNPDGHEIWVYGVTEMNGIAFALGEPKVYKLKYDKDFSFDFTGTLNSAELLSEYCIANEVTIVIAVVDREKTVLDNKTSRNWNFKYATTLSVPTGQIGQ